ncbi:O-succinylbenzoic acid--CoA ligase [Maribacter caenipelagi]|uniref:O-succinylbenzoic acid--CoA ligase n=1 Tax=Maribacter caenipelagi TaxID=1447781 RepID=A0A4R7CY35_9FLAO|nr:AMP-binding protein [Maribacter caenipelagi]TDS13483.1 O-succinylbenzoic acid--CoA ligase [Maribacter caenipelagi]
MNKLSLHQDFSIHGKSISYDDLTEVSYSLIKEGEEFEKYIGEFLLDWIDDSQTLFVKSSGSTGQPKTISLKKEHMINSALATGSYFDLKPKSTALLCLPASYIAGKMMLVRAMVLGLNIHFLPPSSYPLEGISDFFDFGAMVPLQVGNSISKLHQVHKLIIGGAPISNSIREKLKGVDNNSYETYGMTETITHIAVKSLNNIEIKDAPFTVLPNVELTKDDRGCSVINAPKITDEIVRTNDVIELVSDSEFKWLGRIDNVINSGGVKLHPEHIENVLSKYIDTPFFVTGVPDEELGQKVVLVAENVNEQRIQKTIDSIIDFKKFEKPKNILVCKEFIRTESGKVQRAKTLEQILRA